MRLDQARKAIDILRTIQRQKERCELPDNLSRDIDKLLKAIDAKPQHFASLQTMARILRVPQVWLKNQVLRGTIPAVPTSTHSWLFDEEATVQAVKRLLTTQAGQPKTVRYREVPNVTP